MANNTNSTVTAYDSPLSSFFVLDNLPQGAEFGLDTQLWTVAKFSGVKFLPSGLHFFIFAAAPRSAPSASLPESVGAAGALGVRHGLLRFFSAERGETIFESWNNINEGLESDSSRTRSRTVGPAAPESVVDIDQLKKLDATLAAYPATLKSAWDPLVNFVTPTTLARVIGTDEQGCARVDALMASGADELEVSKSAASAQKSWGKQRATHEVDDAQGGEGSTSILDEDELLQFVPVELKKSWPAGARGSELSLWSVDKSYRLSTLAGALGGAQTDKGACELLAELQLSFVLFTLLHNFSALAHYKLLISAFCRATALLLPLSSQSRPTSPPAPATPLLGLPALPLMASFLKTIKAQLEFLPDDFFTVQMPSLDSFFLEELDYLRTSLVDANQAWDRAKKESAGARKVWGGVVDSWEEVRALGVRKWGWQLGEVRRVKRVPARMDEWKAESQAGKGSKWDDSSDDETPAAPAKQEEKREEEDWESYVAIEDLEEGEDAPVVVSDVE